MKMNIAENNIYFVRINKTGSTSLKTWIELSKKPYKRHQYRFGKDKLWQDIKAFKSSHKFISVVRNPYCRAVSSWKFLAKKMSFVEFLNYNPNQLNDNNRNYFIYHTIPQYDFISDQDGSIDYLDYIGKLENINDTLNYIIQNGYSDLEVHKFPHKRKTRHKHYTQYYNDETKQIVEHKYSRDIDYFKYKFGE